MASKLAGLMEGSIDFESSPGKGSAFWFDFDALVDVPASIPARYAGGRMATVAVNEFPVRKSMRALGERSAGVPMS